MCVISIYQEIAPLLEELEQMEKTNKDGGGIAWREKEKIKWKKGLNAKEIYTITKKISFPYIIHFRLATSGGVTKELCHPFPINLQVETNLEGKAEKVIFHNGIWNKWKELCLNAIVSSGKSFLKGKISDTRALAWFVTIYGEEILTLIDEKVVIFSSNSIAIYGNGWIREEKTIYSNQNWKYKIRSYLDYPYFNF